LSGENKLSRNRVEKQPGAALVEGGGGGGGQGRIAAQPSGCECQARRLRMGIEWQGAP